MKIIRSFITCVVLCAVNVSVRADMEDLLFKVQDIFSSAGETTTSIKEWDFYTSGRLALPIFNVANIGIEIGVGAGSVLMPIHPRPILIDFSNNASLGGSAQFLNAGMRILQGQIREMLGLHNIGSEEGPINFFDTSEDAGLKQHWLESMLDFEVTPGMQYGIKMALLVRHYLKHRGSDEAHKIISYLLDFGVLTIRLMRSWQQSSQVIGGISAVIDDKAPQLGLMLRELSKRAIPVMWNRHNDEYFLHRKLDAFWNLIMNADGLLFGPEGNVQRGLGFAVSGFRCPDDASAQLLADFFNKPQINWDVLENDKMKGLPFLDMSGTLIDMYGWQVAKRTDDEGDAVREEYAQVRNTYTSLIYGLNTYDDFGRYDIDGTGRQAAHPELLENQAFLELTAPGGPLSVSQKLPCVVAAGNYLLYCTNKVSRIDAARIVAVIIFQALWQYMDAIRGQGEAGLELQKLIAGHQEKVAAAQAYLKNDESYFLREYGSLLFSRPAINMYPLMADLYNTENRRKIDDILLELKKQHRLGIKARAEVNKQLLELLQKKSTDVEIPEIAFESEEGEDDLGKDQLPVAPSSEVKSDELDEKSVIKRFKEKLLLELQKKFEKLKEDEKTARRDVKTKHADTNERFEKLQVWAQASVALQEQQATYQYVKDLPEDMMLPVAVLSQGIERANAALQKIGTLNKDDVELRLQKFKRKDLYERTQEKKSDEYVGALKDARDGLSHYYEVLAEWYQGVGTFFDDAWGQHATLLIDAMIRKASSFEGAVKKGESKLEEEKKDGAEGKQEVVLPHFCKTSSTDDEKVQMQSFVTHLAQIRTAIWQSDDAGKKINQKIFLEKLQQLLTDAQQYKKEARKVSGKLDQADHPFKAASAYEKVIRDAHVLALGRKQAEALIHQSQEQIATAAQAMRLINEKNIEESAESKKGMSVLRNEMIVFRAPQVVGNTLIGRAIARFSTHLARFNELKPIKQEMEKRLRYARLLYPEMDVAVAACRWFLRSQAPGL